MNERINVLDIHIDKLTAKESMMHFVELIQSEPLGVIELVTADAIMQMDEVPGLKEDVGMFELVLAGDVMILESADVTEKQYLQETKKQTFLKMLLRYLHKNHKRIYLLVESEEEGEKFCDFLLHYYRGTQVGGMAKVSAENRADDMIVNAINGADIDCIISIMSSPLQEEFVIKNRNFMNARVWLGIGKEVIPMNEAGILQNRFTQFVIKKLLKKEIEKRKKPYQNL